MGELPAIRQLFTVPLVENFDMLREKEVFCMLFASGPSDGVCSSAMMLS